MDNNRPYFKNPHLQGDTFFLKGNTTGILLIHGYTATTAEVRQLANALHSLGYTVAGPLLPGHGTYPEDLNKHTWQDWAACVEDAYNNLHAICSEVIVGGESTGGLLALYLAEKHPEIRALITYAPALKLSMPPALSIFLTVASHFIPYIKKKKKGNDDMLWQGYTVYPLKGIHQLLLLEKQVKKSLGKITQPLLIVQGSLDKTVHPDTPSMIAEAVQSNIVEIHWMPESSHCVILDKEIDEVTQITQRFLLKVFRQNAQPKTPAR